MVLPENFEEIFVFDLGRVEFHLDRLGVPGAVRADFFVSWLFGRTADVANARRNHAGNLAKSCLYSPKTSRCERNFLHLRNAPCTPRFVTRPGRPAMLTCP